MNDKQLDKISEMSKFWQTLPQLIKNECYFFALWHGYVAVWQFTLHRAMHCTVPCACVDDTEQQHTGTRLLEALLSCGG